MGTVKEAEMNSRRFLVLHALLEMFGRVGTLLQTPYCRCRTLCRDSCIVPAEGPRAVSRVERDEYGFLPIHIVVQSAHCARFGKVLLVTFVLNEYPMAASVPDAQGRLPLHVAIENGFESLSIDLLVDVEPRALATRFPLTRMYPFHSISSLWSRLTWWAFAFVFACTQIGGSCYSLWHVTFYAKLRMCVTLSLVMTHWWMTSTTRSFSPTN